MILSGFILASHSYPAASAADSPIFKVPRVDGITVDGSSNDWGERGFRVDFLTDPDGGVLPAADFDVIFRLGWNAEGLLILANVRDDIPLEHAQASELWRCDCVEIFVADKVGSENRYQLVIASGADPTYKKLRSHFFDWRPEDRRGMPLTSQASSQVENGGYTLEALLPWKNLGITPRAGLELGFQVTAHDAEENTQQPELLRVCWFPATEPTNPNSMNRIVLSEKPSETVLFRVDREIVPGRCTVSVRGSDVFIGKPVEIRSGRASLARGQMESRDGRSGFVFSFPEPGEGEPWPGVEVLVASRPVAAFEYLPTLESILARYVEALGGKEAIDKIRTRKLTGELTHDFPGQNPPKTVLPAEVTAAAPDKWRLILKTSKGVQQMGFDGEHGWTQDADRILIDNRQARSRLAYLFNPQGATRLEDYFSQLSLQGKVVSEGRAEYAVKAKGSGGSQETLYFDAETGLLNRLGVNIVVQGYRRMLGVLHPVNIAITREGGTSTYLFNDIAANIAIEDTRFAIPDLAEVFPDVFEGLPDSKVLLLLKDFPSEHEDMNVPCRDGRFLYDLILRKGYKRGLEIGTFTGYSALWMGWAFEKTGGKLITIEIDSEPGEKARQNIMSAGLDGVVDARITDAFSEIPKIEGEFDFIFIDAWKPDYVKFLNLLRDRVVTGGAIVGHNVTNYARDMQDYLAAIQNDPGLETTFHELSAEGMSVSIVRGLKPRRLSPETSEPAVLNTPAASSGENPSGRFPVRPVIQTPLELSRRMH
jgi:predicted O-methyltransferase YrrM